MGVVHHCQSGSNDDVTAVVELAANGQCGGACRPSAGVVDDPVRCERRGAGETKARLAMNGGEKGTVARAPQRRCSRCSRVSPRAP